MGRMNLGRVVISPALNAQAFTVYRTTGQFTGGRWVANPVQEISMFGVITVVNEKELQQMEFADKVKGAMFFHCKDEIFVTREGAISDKIMWRGDYYRIFQVGPWVDYGFFKCVGERILGT